MRRGRLFDFDLCLRRGLGCAGDVEMFLRIVPRGYGYGKARGRIAVLFSIGAVLLTLLLWASARTNRAEVEGVRFCDGSSETRPCIFDVGMNTGQDVAQYLGDSNTRVLAVEADTNLVEKARVRFATDAASKRLVVHNLALVADDAAAGEGDGAGAGKRQRHVPFWVNLEKNYMSSFVERLGCRDPSGKEVPPGEHKHCRRVDVPAATCGELLQKHGTPRYMKIDIEGMDVVCLESIHIRRMGNRISLPRYISVEGISMSSLTALAKLGYTRFKMVNQGKVGVGASLVDSGPWGEDAQDTVVGKSWIGFDDAMERIKNKSGGIKSWADLHAKL